MAVITDARIGGARYDTHRMATGAIAATTAGMQLTVARVFSNLLHISPTPYFIPSSSARPDTGLISGPSIPLAAAYARRTAGKLNGVFKVNGVLKRNARIVLIDRYAGLTISATLTNAVGYYEFPYLDIDHNKYIVVAIDPADNERAEAHDRVYPL